MTDMEAIERWERAKRQARAEGGDIFDYLDRAPSPPPGPPSLTASPRTYRRRRAEALAKRRLDTRRRLAAGRIGLPARQRDHRRRIAAARLRTSSAGWWCASR